jgi:MerR family transcriptional regulator, thiopeptide resistance regulator
MLTVGALARRFGLARSTLLYYDAVGLLHPAARSAAGYRRYGEAEVRRLELICTYRRAGLSLEAIARALEAPERGIKVVLEERFGELDAEVSRLREQQRLVASLLQRPDLLERARVIDKRTWVELLAASGMSEDDMTRWHVAFERTAPDKHGRFLELLGLPPGEIEAIRAWSAAGGPDHSVEP